MLQRIIHKLLLRRHFWRYATFDEVAELYLSRMLRMFALRFVTTFTSIFLLNEGYSLLYLCWFWAAFYGVKVLVSWPAAKLAAYYGPKHGTLYSNIIAAVGMVLLALVPHYGVVPLFIWCILHAFSGTLYDLCYLIDFSKVKHTEHAGKEIGYMNIIEKVAAGLAPVLGGVVASYLSPIVAMTLSAVFFLLSAWPLLVTAEPVRTRRAIKFKGFPWFLTRQSLVAEMATGVDIFATATAWTLFLALVVFAGDGGSLYAKIGALTSITLVVSLIASYTFGKVIDKRHGRALLVTSTIVNSFTHLVRPFVGDWKGVIVNNTVNEVATTGYSMAFMRGMFDTADQSGYRFAYLFLIELVANAGAMFAAALLGTCVLIGNGFTGFQAFFAITALLTLVIGFPRFKLYQK